MGGRYFLCCSTPASRQSSLQSGLLPNLTQSRPLSGKSASAPLSKHISPNFRTCRMFHLFISPCHGASYQLIINPCINWRLCLQLKYFFHFETFQIPNFREPFRMPGPGYWLEPHPWGCLEHPWSLRSGTLRAQEPASLHFVRIVSFHKIPSFSLFSQTLSFQLWVCPSRGTMLSEFNRFELALPLLLPKEHLPSQAGCTHQPH